MYEKFYGFTDKPFNMTPDSKFFYPSAKHEEALNCLLLAISERNGFVVITGEIGSGKTTVCRTLLNRLDQATKVALILNTHLGIRDPELALQYLRVRARRRIPAPLGCQVDGLEPGLPEQRID